MYLMKKPRGRPSAMSVQTFCEQYEVGRTKTYEEIRSGRLRARKAGKRTIITTDDADDWVRNVPTMQVPRVEITRRRQAVEAMK
jgi:excisionase family DNA binding protein